MGCNVYFFVQASHQSRLCHHQLHFHQHHGQGGTLLQKSRSRHFVVTQVDTDGWQQTFLYVTLGSVAFINVNAAIFQVCSLCFHFSTLSASIIFLGWNSGCCWQVPSRLHGGSLCWPGLTILLVILGIILQAVGCVFKVEKSYSQFTFKPLPILLLYILSMSSLVYLTGSWWHLCKRNQCGCVGNGGFCHGCCILLLCYQVILLRLAFLSLWKYLYMPAKYWICLSVFIFLFSALSSFSRLWSRMECAPGQNSISTTWERNPKTLKPNRLSSYFPCYVCAI